jgi:NitT/TauT family transport system substrate-binding protein
MTISKRTIGIVAACAAVALAMTGCSSNAEAGTAKSGAPTDKVDVNFGYIADFNGTSLLAIAKEQGLWDKFGVNITTSAFTNGPLQIQALGTGDLDFGYIGPGAVWLPASGKAKIIAINTLGQADRVVAQPGIDSIKDLKGKNVAVPEGTSGDMILTLALEKAGMTKKDINVVPMEPASIVAALSSKQVAGAGFWYPALATVKKQVPGLKELAKNSDFEKDISFPTAFVAGNQVVTKEKEKVTRVLKVLRAAIDFRAKNMDETIAYTAKFLAIDPALVKADAENVKVLSLNELDKDTQDGTVDRWLSGMVDYFVGAGKLKDPADPKDFYTGDLFTGASK